MLATSALWELSPAMRTFSISMRMHLGWRKHVSTMRLVPSAGRLGCGRPPSSARSDWSCDTILGDNNKLKQTLGPWPAYSHLSFQPPAKQSFFAPLFNELFPCRTPSLPDCSGTLGSASSQMYISMVRHLCTLGDHGPRGGRLFVVPPNVPIAPIHARPEMQVNELLVVTTRLM